MFGAGHAAPWISVAGSPASIVPADCGKLTAPGREAHMEARLLPSGDSVEVTTHEGRCFTFPIHELQATRRPPRLDNSARDLAHQHPASGAGRGPPHGGRVRDPQRPDLTSRACRAGVL